MSDKAMREGDSEVLASIRRLVSNGPARRQGPTGADAVPLRGEKLLLTPALRVEDTEPSVPSAAPDISRHQPHDSEMTGAPPSAAPVVEPDWTLEERIAELEAAVGARPDEWEPDGSEDADQETPRRFVFQHRPPVQSIRADEPKSVRRLPEAPAVEEPTAAPVESARVDRDKTNDATAQDPAFDLTGGDDLLDEEVLRDLVAEIVRQELQGEMGQRITRNIRKLVRREISRALLSRDLE